MNLYIVMYHYTRDLLHSRYPEIRGMDVLTFKEQISFLKENFNVVEMEQVLDALDGKCELKKNSCLLTFDDGYIDNFTYAFPILEENGLQGSFFIPGKTIVEHKLLDVNKIHYILAGTGNISELLNDVYERMDYYRDGYDYPPNDELFKEYAKSNRFDTAEIIFIKRMLQMALPEKVRNRIASDLFEKYVGVSEEKLAYELYMTEEQIKTLKRHGMYIGIHGYDHYWLGNLEKVMMENDVMKALEVMEPYIDKNRWVMNYPYGNYNEDVINLISRNNCSMAITTKVSVADIDKDNRFELPRLDCNDFPPKSNTYMNF
ncbi:polysaccharide deacetylase family protein [Butyrivibrio fibrisolvens]|uniref:polysaccharide deacetylase family protein n=1 Tax=Butyrivibrio fibrisolvens TaxID=831 RepID=UPI00200AFB56|nr:polysaccharide deacetylase family protein [Butyrivibrio fibrisolvens]